MDNRSNSRANTWSRPCWAVFISFSLTSCWWVMITCRIASATDHSSLCPFTLSMGGYWPPMVTTGNGELGFDSGEGAWEMATTSKEGSRRANYPILTQGGSDNTYLCCGASRSNRNEDNPNPLARTHWRASLVPAAAVIPAPIAYIKVVAVKKLVVGFLALDCCPGTPVLCWWHVLAIFSESLACSLLGALELPIFYFEKIRVFKAGLLLWIH